jgi:hypothetical protein
MIRSHITCSFFAEAQRIAAEDYVPSIEDISHMSDIPEKGIMETHFNYVDLALRVLRVNYGQQDWFSIRKWIPLLQDVMNVMFIVSLADYDEPGISGVGQQVCASSYNLTQTICVTTSHRRDWLNTSLFSMQSSTLAGSGERRSYYTLLEWQNSEPNSKK